MKDFDLDRFVKAQETTYLKALSEIKNGKKQSHFMWYIFPQIKGLGKTEISNYYAIKNLEEGISYLENPILKGRLLEISQAVLDLNTKNIEEVFGSIDSLKLKSSMTLFHQIDKEEKIFIEVLNKYFNKELDKRTIELLRSNK